MFLCTSWKDENTYSNIYKYLQCKKLNKSIDWLVEIACFPYKLSTPRDDDIEEEEEEESVEKKDNSLALF